MSGNHHGRAHELYVPGTSPVHRLGAPAKLIGLVAFVVIVAVSDPRRPVPLLVDLAIVLAVARMARLPLRLVAVRSAAIVPFVAFAVFLPLIGTGDRVEVVGVSLSVDGLWSAWGIVAKAGIGAGAATVVTATTPLPTLLEGLARVRVPAVFVSIIGFLVRYVDVVADELHRMRRAMTARGHDPRWLWQVGPVASSIGAVFVRSYERGERIHFAMLARGYDGRPPAPVRDVPLLRGQWRVLAPAIVAVSVSIVAGVVLR